MDAVSPQIDSKIYNLTITNATLMKLTTIIYVYKMFNLAENWGVTHSAYEGINQKPLKMSQNINFLAQFQMYLKKKMKPSYT